MKIKEVKKLNSLTNSEINDQNEGDNKTNNPNSSKDIDKLIRVVVSGLALGASFYMVKNGIIDYDKFINFESIKEAVLSNPILDKLSNIEISKQTMDVTLKCIEQAIKTLGMNGLVLAMKSANFAKEAITQTFGTDEVKNGLKENVLNHPTVLKIKSIFKGKNSNEKSEALAEKNTNVESFDDDAQNSNDKKEKSHKKIPFKTISQGLSIGLTAFLISKGYINFNDKINFDALSGKISELASSNIQFLPHKLFAFIEKTNLIDKARNLDLNKVALIAQTSGLIDNIISKKLDEKREAAKSEKQNSQEISDSDDGPKVSPYVIDLKEIPFKPAVANDPYSKLINFKKIVTKIGKESEMPTLASFKKMQTSLAEAQRGTSIKAYSDIQKGNSIKAYKEEENTI